MIRALLVTTVLVALVAPERASAVSFVIRGDERLGTFAVKADGTLSGAIRAFGQPGRLRKKGESCTSQLRPDDLLLQPGRPGPVQAEVRPLLERDHGRRALAHREGAGGRHARASHQALLPAGDLPSRAPLLLALAGWWLITRRSPFGSGGEYPGLLAETRNGIVVTFRVRYPAGGD